MLCIICHEEIKTGEGKVFTCGHVFHGNCSEAWFRTNNPKTCPSCRAQLDPSKCITLYIATDADTPEPSRTRNRLVQENADLKARVDRLQAEKRRIEEVRNRLVQENANSKARVDFLVEEKRRIEEEKDIMSVHLNEANIRIESQRIASMIQTGELISLPQQHELYDNLHPEEAVQLLKSYHHEIQETLKKFLDLKEERHIFEEQIMINEGHILSLQQENTNLRADLALLENVEAGQCLPPMRASALMPHLTPRRSTTSTTSPPTETRRATLGPIRSPSTSTSTGDADSISSQHSSNLGATAIPSRGAAGTATTPLTVTTRSSATAAGTTSLQTAVRVALQTSVRSGGGPGTATTAPTVTLCAATAVSTNSAGATAAIRGRSTSTNAARNSSTGTTAAARSGTSGGITTAARNSSSLRTYALRNAAAAAAAASVTRNGLATSSSGVTRDNLRASRRSLSGSEVPAKLSRKM